MLVSSLMADKANASYKLSVANRASQLVVESAGGPLNSSHTLAYK